MENDLLSAVLLESDTAVLYASEYKSSILQWSPFSINEIHPNGTKNYFKRHFLSAFQGLFSSPFGLDIKGEIFQ